MFSPLTADGAPDRGQKVELYFNNEICLLLYTYCIILWMSYSWLHLVHPIFFSLVTLAVRLDDGINLHPQNNDSCIPLSSSSECFHLILWGFCLLFLTFTYISPHCSRYSSFVLFCMVEVHLECPWTVVFLSHKRSTNSAFAEIVCRAPLSSSHFFQRVYTFQLYMNYISYLPLFKYLSCFYMPSFICFIMFCSAGYISEILLRVKYSQIKI